MWGLSVTDMQMQSVYQVHICEEVMGSCMQKIEPGHRKNIVKYWATVS